MVQGLLFRHLGQILMLAQFFSSILLEPFLHWAQMKHAFYIGSAYGLSLFLLLLQGAMVLYQGNRSVQKLRASLCP